MNSFWKSRRVCVLGGAGFIGSHLVEHLLPLAEEVSVIDNFSSGTPKNISKDVRTYCLDLRESSTCSILKRYDTVFHLASNVGGRAYLVNHPQQMWENLEIDTTVFRACADYDVEKVVFFSSACVYPVNTSEHFRESYNVQIEKADSQYGKAKLISEMMLQDFPFSKVCIRPFTVYGQRMKENRAIGSFIAKTFIQQDPFEVWGDGHQIVDWVYVKDVVQGAVLAAEKLDDGVVNIGTGDLNTPTSVLQSLWKYVNWRPKEVVYLGDMPVSPPRLADTNKIRGLGWKMNFSLDDGIKETVDWYYQTHDVQDIRENLERKLLDQ